VRRRALIVAYCFPPHAAIGTHRTLRLVSHLADIGWDVDVLTVNPARYLAGTPVDEQLLTRVPPPVRVVRSGALRGFSAAGRVIGRLRAAQPAAVATAVGSAASGRTQPSTARALKTWLEELAALPDKDIGWLAPAALRGVRAFAATRPDVIFSSAPPWTTHLVALALASSFRCRWVADFRDPWVRSPWTRYTTSAALSIATRLEHRVVRRADAVVFTTRTARDEFAAHYGPPLADRFHVVFNGCDATEFPTTPAAPTAPQAPQAPQALEAPEFVLLHAGTLYGGRSPLPLLRAVAGLCNRRPELRERLRVIFLGATGFDGLDGNRLCRELGIDDAVTFTPRVDRGESLMQMRKASALLILQAGTSMAIPGKLYEYLAGGRPVLALCEEGEMADLIRENRLGLAVSSTDERAVEEALAQLIDAPPGSWAEPHAALYDGRLRAAELAGILGDVADARTTASICVA
jgi:glycosyltransferase involved in cell wall biosynthesis